MNIGFISTEFPAHDRPEGGLANYLYRTTRALLKQGHQITVFTMSNRDHRAVEDGIQVIEISYPSLPTWPQRLLPTHFGLPLLQILTARTVMNSVRSHPHFASFDVMEATNYFSPGLFLGKAGVPMITRMSTFSRLWRQEHGPGLELSHWLELRQVRRSATVYSPSRLIAELVEESVGVPVRTIRPVLPEPPAQLDSKIAVEHNLREHSYLLFVGRIRWMKGPDLFIQAVEPMLRSHSDLSIVIIGRDEGCFGLPVEEALQRLAEFGSRVVYLERLNRSQLWSVLSRARALVVPSRIDNYPNVALEAMVNGTPVIGSRNSSLDEIVIEGENGFLFANGSVEELRDCLLRVVELNSHDYADLRQRTLRVAASVADEERIRSLEQLYEEVAESSLPRRHT